MRDFVASWYLHALSPEDTFVRQADALMRGMLAELVRRLERVDFVSLIVKRMCKAPTPTPHEFVPRTALICPLTS